MMKNYSITAEDIAEHRTVWLWTDNGDDAVSVARCMAHPPGRYVRVEVRKQTGAEAGTLVQAFNPGTALAKHSGSLIRAIATA